jgi:hypothetical protein
VAETELLAQVDLAEVRFLKVGSLVEVLETLLQHLQVKAIMVARLTQPTMAI